MVTVSRVGGFRIVIFVDDHHPAHVHVFGDGEAKIDLFGRDGSPTLIWAYGMKPGEVRKAMRAVADDQKSLLARWKDIHGWRD